MKRLAKNIIVITIPALFLCVLLLEGLFRVVIPATDPPLACFDTEIGVFKFCPNAGRGTATYGKWAQQRGRWRINNEGWNSPVDYARTRERPCIAVIGDSYIEAFQVDAEESYPSILRSSLGGRYDVYSFGMSGASLAEYLNMSRYVTRRFDPDILIFNVVHNDLDESVYHLNLYDTHQMRVRVDDIIVEEAAVPNPSFAEYSARKRWLRKSALVRYCLFNLQIKQTIMDLMEARNYNANIDVDKVESNLPTIERAVSYIVGRIRDENPGRRVMFVMDAPRNDIYQGRPADSNVVALHRIMRETCDSSGLELLDLTDAMRADFAANGRWFSSKYDSHWDEYGHEFVAQQLLPRFGAE
jgi:hypothetical protein